MRRPRAWPLHAAAAESAKRLYFDVIPRAVDDYLAAIEKLPAEEPAKALENAAWHVHDGAAPANRRAGVSFGMLLNLVSVANTDEQGHAVAVPAALRAGRDAGERALSRPAAAGAVAYYQDFVRPKKFRLPDGEGARGAEGPCRHLRKLPEERERRIDPERGLRGGQAPLRQEELRQWFKALYEVLLGAEQGPRMGAFIKLYGRDNVVRLIERALAGEDLGKAA